MKKIIKTLPSDFKNSVFDEIGNKWLLVTAKDEKNGRINAMTASWGTMGILWNKPVCVLFIRPQRHTKSLVEKEDVFSVNILESGRSEAYKICGSLSGRDTDKVKKSGLTPVKLDGAYGFEESETVMVLKKLYVEDLKESSFVDKSLLSHYTAGDFHTAYVCEITEIYRAEEN